MSKLNRKQVRNWLLVHLFYIFGSLSIFGEWRARVGPCFVCVYTQELRAKSYATSYRITILSFFLPFVDTHTLSHVSYQERILGEAKPQQWAKLALIIFCCWWIVSGAKKTTTHIHIHTSESEQKTQREKWNASKKVDFLPGSRRS